MTAKKKPVDLGEFRATPGTLDLETWTNRARMALTNAVWEAERLDHHYIGTEHVLLGLLCDPASIASGVLVSLGVDLESARKAVEFFIASPRGPSGGEPGDVG
jgi:ATP-dependent Clp protease ATP-binding subunit ClpC